MPKVMLANNMSWSGAKGAATDSGCMNAIRIHDTGHGSSPVEDVVAPTPAPGVTN